jgi:hypothetical protein
MRWLMHDGAVEGRVVYGRGRPAASVLIVLRSLATGDSVRIATTAQGEFRFTNRSSGRHHVRFARVGLEGWNARVALSEDVGEDPVIRLCEAQFHLDREQSRR